MMRRHTVTMEPTLFAMIQERAQHNRRSMSQEIVYLVECALATENEGNLDLMRTLNMMINGGSIRASVTESAGVEES